MASTHGHRLYMEEWNSSSSSITATITVLPSISVNRSTARFTHIWRRMLQAFVPEGFPNSVTPDYAPFQLWDTLQGLSTYIRTMLSTQALLSAIGVGEKSATVLGATFQWFLRDLTGMIGGILFTLYQGSNLDSNAKMWRLIADLMNDLGMMMDLVSPLFPSLFIFVVCLGSLSRSFTGVASGATRAALTQHFALQSNAADISAKEGSQETVATITGMAIGMLLARFTVNNPIAIWFSFLSLTIFHLYANYKAVRCLALTSLNLERCSILVHRFIKSGQILSPSEVSKIEHVLPLARVAPTVHLGVRVSTLNSQELVEMFRQAESHYMNEKYIIFEKEGCLKVVLQNEASSLDVVRAFVHGIVVGKLKEDAKFWMDNNYDILLRKATESGWKTSRLSQSIAWRATWRWESPAVKFGKTS